MNRISEQILEAVGITMDERLSQLPFDKTIQATIQSIEDLDTGEYRVKYNDGIISAFAADPKVTYKQGDMVYVTVPEGDFSNKKFISHRITNNSLTASQYSELANAIFEVSPNFSALGFSYNEMPISLIVGEHETKSIISEEIAADAQMRFKAYSDQYEYVQISADFMTEFLEEYSSGDYGIQIVFKNSDGNNVTYFLNLNDFNGDPYRLSTWSPQSTIIKLPKGQITEFVGASFYESGFEKKGTEEENIFMQNFSLNFVEKVDLTEIPYYLNILPLDGVAFSANTTVLRLQGQPYSSGELLPAGQCIFQWFERDLSIVPGDDSYDKRAGWGWRSIKGANSQLLVVNKGDWYQQSYKLIVVYNSTTLMTKEITLISGALDVEIEQVVENNKLYLQLTNDNYIGKWYYLSSNGNQVLISEEATSKSPDVSNLLLYSPMTFYCSVYQGTVYQGELTYVMQNMESESDVSVVFTGESFFSYDANGDINIYDAELERSLQAEIVWKKGIISSAVKIRWLDFNNEEITAGGIDYRDKDSMLKHVRVDNSENKLYYTIKHKFKQTPSKNNSFRVEISTLDGQIYTFDKEIVFTKTGDPGTNGTRYQSLITITSTNKFVGNGRMVELTCSVYKDQELFPGTVSFNWDPFNLSLTHTDSNNKVRVSANNSDNKRYVKVTVTISDAGKTITLYDFFPIDTCERGYDIAKDIELSSLPKYIQYNATGRNPQYQKQLLSKIDAIVKSENSIITIDKGYLYPVAEFVDPPNNIGLLRIQDRESEPIFIVHHPVPTYINTFGNEAINGWDGVSVDVDTAGGKILAPQVGAGTKDDQSNKFTGVVMGRDSVQQKVGLYGYQAGVNSFGLTEEGIAYFGAENKNRITIDGTQATIIGGKGGSDSEGKGMTITLSAADSSADAIRVGKDNFIVNYGGKLIAKSAVIDGTITAGAGSVIGGWTLQQNRLYSGSGASYVALDSGTTNVNQAIWAGKVDSATAPFRVTRAGALIATSADITGDIKANTGYIGGTSGWAINSNRIYGAKSNKYVVLSTQGSYAFFAGADGDTDTTAANAPFWVKFNGDMRATSADITGKITANEGKIGNWTINKSQSGRLESSISEQNTRIYLDGSVSTDDKYVLYISAKTPASGESEESSQASGRVTITPNGHLSATSAEIKGTIKSKAGEIGSWIIDRTKISTIPANTTGDISSTTGMAKSGMNGKVGDMTISNIAFWGGMTYIKNSGWLEGDDSGTFFAVTHGGKLYCRSADIKGTITADNGYVGGWKITSAGLQNGEGNDRIFISNTGAMKVGNFSVTSSGKLIATGADISGKITSQEGSIGGWTITRNAISTLSSETATLNSTTGMAKANFYGYQGKTTPRSSDGAIPINNIAFWSGMDYIKYNDSYYLRGDPDGTFFAVTHDGKLYCNKASLQGVSLYPSGSTSNYLEVTDTGLYYHVGGGKLGSWSISTSREDNYPTLYISISGGSIDLTPEGKLNLPLGDSIMIGSKSLQQYIQENAVAKFG